MIEDKTKEIEAKTKEIEVKTKEIEAKTKEIEAKTKEIEAKSKEIEAKCLSKAEIKELITDDCLKNPCENAKHPTKHVPSQNAKKTARRAPTRRHMIAGHTQTRRPSRRNRPNGGFVPNSRSVQKG